MRVSHETIYRTLFVHARGALRKELTACLRTGRTQRRAHKRTEHSGTGRIRNMVPISARPSEAEDRAIPGHWEGDLLMGQGGSAIATLVERTSPRPRPFGEGGAGSLVHCECPRGVSPATATRNPNST